MTTFGKLAVGAFAMMMVYATFYILNIVSLSLTDSAIPGFILASILNAYGIGDLLDE